METRAVDVVGAGVGAGGTPGSVMHWQSAHVDGYVFVRRSQAEPEQAVLLAHPQRLPSHNASGATQGSVQVSWVRVFSARGPRRVLVCVCFDWHQ